MLKYFKYIAFVSFLLVLVAAFFAGLYFRSFAGDSVIRRSVQDNNVVMVEQFVNKLLCRYEPVFTTLSAKPVTEWSLDPNLQKFQILSNTVLGISAAEKISLYNDKGEVFFSTSPEEPVFFESEGAGFVNHALSEGTTSRLLPSLGFRSDHGEKKGSYVQTVLKVSTAGCRLPAGTTADPNKKPITLLIEVFDNVSGAWDELYFFQALVSLGIIFTFALLYLALYITSRKTEKLISKQHEEKLNLERAKTMAETQNQQKSMFLANVSHELRTPLNAIIGFSEIIKDEVMGPVGHPQYKEYITDINTSGVHLLSLINDILDYSKAEARKLDVEAVDIDLSKIAHSCMRLVEPRAKEAQVKLIENLPAKHVILSADPKRMKQVILNLLSNAVKFTPEEGEVSLTIQEDLLDGVIHLIVADTGIGIAAKDISKAMSPFGQIDSSVSRRYEGTGLGLPLTKKLTELMGGKFEIKSEVGLGTTICLTFSIMNQKQSQADVDKF